MSTVGEQSDKTGGTTLLSEFSSVVIAAHEVKAPLAVLRQLSLELQHGALSESEKRQLASQIQLISERALRLTSDLTKAQRLQTELFETNPINVLQLCDEVVREMTPLYQARDRQLFVRPGQAKTPVVANRDLLRRILLNFADNALHYSDEKTPVYLSASVRRKEKIVRLGIRDEGPMLPAAFWQLLQHVTSRPQSVHARPQSSGLGLAISHQFAEAMGSHIGAIRHRDGTTFYVDVPISTQLSLL